MSSSNVETPSSASPEETQQATPPPTKTVTKQKDPRRFTMGRQLGLRSQEFKRKKREMMESGKYIPIGYREGENNPKSGNKTQIIAAGVVIAALAIGYIVHETSWGLLPKPKILMKPHSLPAIAHAPVNIPPKPILQTSGVVNME